MNYNENGIVYETYSQNIVSQIGGYLPDRTTNSKYDLHSKLYEEAKNSETHSWLRGYLGVLHHLDAFLLSNERIADQVVYLRNNALKATPDPEYPKVYVKRTPHQEPYSAPPCLIGISATRIEIEAETFLLRAVSLLERLSKLIADECSLTHKNFFTLEASLRSNVSVDARCAPLLSILTSVKPLLSKTVVSDGASTSLRNIIAHRASSPEILDKGFSINWVSEDCLFPFDAELGEFPLVATVRELARVVPFYVVESLRVLLSPISPLRPIAEWARQPAFDQSAFEPTWMNPFIHFSAYIDLSNKGPLIALVRWLPGGFQTHQRHLREEILSLAVNPSKSA